MPKVRSQKDIERDAGRRQITKEEASAADLAAWAALKANKMELEQDEDGEDVYPDGWGPTPRSSTMPTWCASVG